MISTILSVIIALGVLVFVHELGHFLVAKRAGIRVERFSLGYPPKMVGIQLGETEYCISWIPFGGYVKMSGENPDEDPDEDAAGGNEPWRFHKKSVPDRAAVILAGPAANFVLAVFVYSLIFFAYGADWVETTVIGAVSMPQRSSSSPSLTMTVKKSWGRVLIWPMRAFKKPFAARAAPRKFLNPRSNTGESTREFTI